MDLACPLGLGGEQDGSSGSSQVRHGHQVWVPGLLLNLLCLSQRSAGCLDCLSGLPSLPSLSPHLLLSSHSVTSHSFLVAISDTDCCSSLTFPPLVSSSWQPYEEAHSQVTSLLRGLSNVFWLLHTQWGDGGGMKA